MEIEETIPEESSVNRLLQPLNHVIEIIEVDFHGSELLVQHLLTDAQQTQLTL